MMTTKTGLSTLVLPLLLLGPTAPAQEQQPAEPPSERADKTLVPLRLQIVLSRYRGEEKLGSLPYSLAFSSQGMARVRMGVQVPIRTGTEGNQLQYRDVGTNVDCRAVRTPAAGDRYLVSCTFDQSSVFSYAKEASGSVIPLDGPISSVPLFRSFRTEAQVLLRDGETALHTSAADPVSGEVLKAEVTLNVVK